MSASHPHLQALKVHAATCDLVPDTQSANIPRQVQPVHKHKTIACVHTSSGSEEDSAAGLLFFEARGKQKAAGGTSDAS